MHKTKHSDCKGPNGTENQISARTPIPALCVTGWALEPIPHISGHNPPSG